MFTDFLCHIPVSMHAYTPHKGSVSTGNVKAEHREERVFADEGGINGGGGYLRDLIKITFWMKERINPILSLNSAISCLHSKLSLSEKSVTRESIWWWEGVGSLS